MVAPGVGSVKKLEILWGKAVADGWYGRTSTVRPDSVNPLTAPAVGWPTMAAPPAIRLGGCWPLAITGGLSGAGPRRGMIESTTLLPIRFPPENSVPRKSKGFA